MSPNARATARALPTGIITFLFTDIEGSTRRWEVYPEAMRETLRRHDALLRAAIERHDGVVFKTIGDAFCAAFDRVEEAALAALDAQRSFAAEDWSAVDGLLVRMALHVGRVDEREGDYFGPPVNRVARLLGIAHGGQTIVSGSAAEIARERLAPHMTLHDLGSHRLKDLDTPEKVFQLVAPGLRETFPPLRSLDVRPHNLPHQVTSFIGRSGELEELAHRLEETRLLTLVGTGGVGKTRLSLQLGAELLERFPDGVWFVELAPISDPELVAPQTAAAVGAPVGGGRTAHDAVVAALRYRQALVIFDNCEHVSRPAAALVDAILRSAAKVHVVATSRQRLELTGEAVHRVGSLGVPEPGTTLDVATALEYSAVALFVERARAATGRFELTERNVASVVEIARRLDGIALALELAAPKLAVLSPQQLAERLNERFRILTSGNRTLLPRQQTMRALIDWSYDLLDERERKLFRRLAVFVGGWTLEAAIEICGGGDLEAWDVFELLSSLVAKSLVIAETRDDEQRYRLLESTRAYARERLEQGGDDEATAARHARFYAARMRELRPLVEAMDDRAWQRAVLADLDNVRAALECTLVQERDVRTGLELVAELHREGLVLQPQEASRWFELASRMVQRVHDPALAAAIFRRYSAMLASNGQPIALRIAAAEAAVEAATAGDPIGFADAKRLLATCVRDAGRLDEAGTMFQEAWELLEPHAVKAAKVGVLVDWASNDLKRGDLEQARRRLVESVRLARPQSMSYALVRTMLGEIEFAAGDVRAARASAQQARIAFSELCLRLHLGVSQCNLAAYAMALDEFEEAREALAQALAILRDSGSPIYLTIVLEHCAVLAGLTGDEQASFELAGYTDTRYATLGSVREGTERRGFERLVSHLAERFGRDEVERRKRSGVQLGEDEALTLGLTITKGHGNGNSQ
jgi:predicted ATPase/class 3 adenylate cyclase